MGRQLTTGQICKKLDCSAYKRKEESGSEIIPLPDYITEKVNLLHELGYKRITEEVFNGCVNEIQVDNRAHTIIFGEKKRYAMA